MRLPLPRRQAYIARALRCWKPFVNFEPGIMFTKTLTLVATAAAVGATLVSNDTDVRSS